MKIFYIDVNDEDIHLNHSNRIKYFSIHSSREFIAPILPYLIEFEMNRHSGENADLRNLIYSSSLKKLTAEECYSMVPNQLKERGVITRNPYAPHFLDDDKMRNMMEMKDNCQDDNFTIYEDEVTVY